MTRISKKLQQRLQPQPLVGGPSSHPGEASAPSPAKTPAPAEVSVPALVPVEVPAEAEALGRDPSRGLSLSGGPGPSRGLCTVPK